MRDRSVVTGRLALDPTMRGVDGTGDRCEATASTCPPEVTRRRWTRVALLTTSAVLLVGCSSDHSSVPATREVATPSFLCPLQRGTAKLPAISRRGLIQHLVRYPVLRLATTSQRTAARRLLTAIETAADAGRWRSPSVAARSGFVRARSPRRLGDPSVHYLHAELRRQRRAGPRLDPARPKALIYANAPGRRLVLVGAMYSMKRGELGPTPGDRSPAGIHTSSVRKATNEARSRRGTAHVLGTRASARAAR